MSGNGTEPRYCTGCALKKRHHRFWLGTYCLPCRFRSIPRRWRFYVTAWFYDVKAGRR